MNRVHVVQLMVFSLLAMAIVVTYAILSGATNISVLQFFPTRNTMSTLDYNVFVSQFKFLQYSFIN